MSIQKEKSTIEETLSTKREVTTKIIDENKATKGLYFRILRTVSYGMQVERIIATSVGTFDASRWLNLSSKTSTIFIGYKDYYTILYHNVVEGDGTIIMKETIIHHQENNT